MGDQGDTGDEPELLRDVRWLSSQMHPAELVVCVVRGHGWGCDPGGVAYIDSDRGGRAGTGGHGEVELYFDDSVDTTKRVSRAEYLGALADVCMERGFPEEHDVIRAVLADSSHAATHPAADVARAVARCARLAELLEAHGWERRGDEIHHEASGVVRSTTRWDDHVEALRAELETQARAAGAAARPEWLAYQRSMMAAIDALLAEEQGK
ncbi:MAG TPA: hypothetical protein VM261_32665 [Kofleriaceae bacterium]|nr:hypothetical protein [Kofleriaceae bacterium]